VAGAVVAAASSVCKLGVSATVSVFAGSMFRSFLQDIANVVKNNIISIKKRLFSIKYIL
jgi:hypothetical protein